MSAVRYGPLARGVGRWHRRLSLAVLVAAVVAMPGCGGDARDGDAPGGAAASLLPAAALPPDLDRVLRDYERAYGARDAAALSALFAEDGFVLQAGRPPAKGRAAIRAALAGQGGALTLVPVGYAASDSVAWVVGTFGAERDARRGGKFVLALRRRGSGPWEIAADMDNANGR